MSGSAAEATHEVDHEADQEDQSKRAATDGGAANIKPTAAKEKKKEQDNDYDIHRLILAAKGGSCK